MTKIRGSFEKVARADASTFTMRRRGLWVMRVGERISIEDESRVNADAFQIAGTHVAFKSNMPDFYHRRIDRREIPRIRAFVKGIEAVIERSNSFIDDQEKEELLNALCPGVNTIAPEQLTLGKSVGTGNLMTGIDGAEEGYAYLFPGMSVITGSNGSRGSESWQSHWILEDPSVYTGTVRAAHAGSTDPLREWMKDSIK